jgi:hypothetical protein
MPGTWAKRAPLLGILGVALVFAAFAVGGETPDANDSAQKVVNYYTDNDSQQIFAAVLLAYGALVLVLFAGVLRSALRPLEGGTGGVSALILAGGVMMSLGMLLFAGITFALADVTDDLEPSAAQALNALNGDLFMPVTVGLSLFNLATGITILRAGGLPRWLGWALLVVALIAITPGGFFALPLTGIWILIVSVMLYRNPPTTAQVQTNQA